LGQYGILVKDVIVNSLYSLGIFLKGLKDENGLFFIQLQGIYPLWLDLLLWQLLD
jgi:hypothetical protein